MESEVRNPGAGKPGPGFRGKSLECRDRRVGIGELEGFFITILKNDNAKGVFLAQV